MAVFLCACPVYSAPREVTLEKPDLVCPETEIEDAVLQGKYKRIWEYYEKSISSATARVEAAIDEQVRIATEAGALGKKLGWKDMAKRFTETGKIRWEEEALKKRWKSDTPFPEEFSTVLEDATKAYNLAKDDLKEGYGAIVKDLTRKELDSEAIKIRDEMYRVFAAKPKRSPAQPRPKPQDTAVKPKEAAAPAKPKNGKYRFVFSDGTGGGLLIELENEILWIHGDINPKRPTGVFIWPNPRPVPCRVVGTKVLTDDGDPATNKWRCAISWDTAAGTCEYLYDNFRGTKLQRRGTVTAGSW